MTINAPIALEQALIVVAGLGITLAINALLLRRAFAPLERSRSGWTRSTCCGRASGFEVAPRRRVGRVVAAFNQMLDRLESERHESGRRVLAAQEAERIGIARGLHDEVGQVLTGVLLQLNSIADAGARRTATRSTRRSRRCAGRSTRCGGSRSELRPEMLEHLGLVSALTELSTTFARARDSRSSVASTPSLPPLSPEAELAVYRIAQESLTNVARHARGDRGDDRARARARTASSCASSTTAAASRRRRRKSTAACAACASARCSSAARWRSSQVAGGGVEVRLEVPAAERADVGVAS